MNNKQECSLDTWIARLFSQPELLRMGHSQRKEDMNLGLGWLYYGLGRIIRPRRAVVIGSLRGFVPMVLGKALQDNLEPGDVTFIDPSLADDFWSEPDAAALYFEGFDISNIRHHCVTTQEFVESEAYGGMEEVGLVFIDGYHSAEQARFDFRAFETKLAPRGVVLFHDSMVEREDRVYGAEKAYEMGVVYFIDELKQDPDLQVFDLPFGSTGVTLVRKLSGVADRDPREWLDGPP